MRKSVGNFAKLTYFTTQDARKISFWKPTIKWIADLRLITILALTGPFGTYTQFSLYERLSFWSLSILAGSLFIHLAVYFLIKIGNQEDRQIIIAALVGSVLGSVPATAAIMQIYARFSGEELALNSYPTIWANVVIIAILVSLAHVVPDLIRDRLEQKAATDPDAPQLITAEPSNAIMEDVPLLAHLPDGTRPCQIMSFSMQDHYVEVTTMEDKKLLLMRMSDAIAQLGTLRGERVHRSHWVSLRHLVDIKKDGRRHVALLTDDRKVPISNPYLSCAQQLLKEKNAAQ